MTTFLQQLGQATESDLQRLVLGASESEVLDFKGGPYQGGTSDWSAGQEFAKDVAAFANHRGGVIVIGVREKAKVAIALKSLTRADAESEERLLRQWLAKHTAPTVDVEVNEVPADDGGYYLVVSVPRSLYQPHAVLVEHGRRFLIFPVRDGQDTRYLTEHEVARRYVARMQGDSLRRDAFDRLIADGASRLDRGSSVWLWLSMRPEQPIERRLNTETANAISSWWSNGGLQGPLGTRLSGDHAIVGPGCVTFTGHRLRDDQEESDPRDSYIELHADGSSFVALDVDLRTSEDSQVGQIGYFTIVDGMIPIVDVAARWATDQVGAQGTAAVAAGLIDTTAQHAPLQIVRGESGDLRRVRATRPLHRPFEIIVTRDDTLADLAACVDLQNRLALAHDCLSYILQRIGRPEPVELTSDGRIRWRAWKYYEQVKRWAEFNGVPLAEGLGPHLQV